MTGRDLIIYILQNNLEDMPLYADGKLLGFMTAAEAANKFKVGLATVQTWYLLNQVEGIIINGVLYIPENVQSPISEGGNE